MKVTAWIGLRYAVVTCSTPWLKKICALKEAWWSPNGAGRLPNVSFGAWPLPDSNLTN